MDIQRFSEELQQAKMTFLESPQAPRDQEQFTLSINSLLANIPITGSPIEKRQIEATLLDLEETCVGHSLLPLAERIHQIILSPSSLGQRPSTEEILDNWALEGSNTENRASAKEKILFFLASSDKSILDLRDLYLTSLPDIFKDHRFNDLEKLNLSGNQLTELPDFIGQLTNLTHLSLSNNLLAVFPESIGLLTGLSGLDLSDNHLAALPESIGQLRGLTHLILSNNHLAALPESIGLLSSLDELILSRNRLTALPDSFGPPCVSVVVAFS